METTLFYLLRVSIAAGILYVSYKLILSKKTFHSINRAVLLSIVALSLILPLFTIQLPRFNKQEEEQPIIAPASATATVLSDESPIYANYATTVPASTPTPIPWTQYLLIAYLAGVVFAFFRLLLSYVCIRLIIRKAEKKGLNDKAILCVSEQKISPFSWKRFIVIPATDLSDDSHDIIRHEQAHLAFNHSRDLLLFNLYTLFFWFNPFAWLLRRELQITHEYQADAKVLSQGADLKNYQLLLIRKCVGEQKFALAHNFEYNNLQKRIHMTMKEKSGAMQKWMYGTLIIAVMGSIVGISCTKTNTEHNESTSGHIEGSFSKTSINGKMQIHTNKKTADIIKNSKGKMIGARAPGDSILGEFNVINGKFSFDYHFSEQHQIRLVFIDSKNTEWKLDFINPYAQSMVKFSSDYCLFDHEANITIKVISDKARMCKIANIKHLQNKNNNNIYEVSRSIEAQMSGSPATAEMFKQQLQYHEKVGERRSTNAEYETGTVFDSKTKAKLSNVKIVNLNTKEETTSDKNGYYKIKAYPKNLISFSMNGFLTSVYYAELISNHNQMLRRLTSQDINNDGKTYSVKGEVLDVDFKPIVNASVWVDGTNTKQLTDGSGKYTLTARYKGIIYVAKKGYKDTTMIFVTRNTDVTSFLHQ
jgi:beta-lactamase regulating signal transducer with metallopeptidase domain